MRQIHALRYEAVRVLRQLGVNRRQKRRVVADVVFDEENGLHAELAGVVRDVPPILDVLHDRRDQPHVALPEKHTIDR